MIYLLWATVRPGFMKETYQYWLDKAINPDNIKIKIAVNTHEQRQELAQFDDIIVTNQKYVGTVYPIYMITTVLQLNGDDIIIVASDDFYPPQGWDEHLISKLKDKCACYFVNDGYQASGNEEIKASITMPVMTFGCLCKLNKILYSLDYYHYYGDTELYNNLKDLDLIIDDRLNDRLIFEHKNCVTGKRVPDEYDGKYNDYVYADRNTFNRRALLPVEERIKRTEGVW